MEMALEQLLIAFAKSDEERGEFAIKVDWDDLCLAFEMAREALPGRYMEIVREMIEEDKEVASCRT